MTTASAVNNLQCACEATMGKVWRRLSFGVGILLNEVWRQMSLSFGLVFYTKVIGLSSGQAGIILAVGMVAGLMSTIMFGYLCDKVDVPFLSRMMGRKKTWYLFTTIFLGPFMILAFSRCYPCTDSSSMWVAFAYFLCGYCGGTFMYGATEMAYLSLIPVISPSQDEAIILNSLGWASITMLFYVTVHCEMCSNSENSVCQHVVVRITWGVVTQPTERWLLVANRFITIPK